MQTLRKLPTQAPKAKTKHRNNSGFSTAKKVTGTPRRMPTIRRV
jgi:hypothetical protein